MDTRRKIITPAAARALPGPLTVVTAYFDGLRAAALPELEALQQDAPLLALVLPRPGELLPLAARAELAAALAVIDYVVACDEDTARALLRDLPARRVARLEAAEQARTEELIEHVRSSRNR